jgi:4-amino-4-deoxy-L-arabinose transferase-like glycosyltransferase
MRALLAALAAALLVLAANLPFIGRGELESEEARRALPAEAMLAAESGDVLAWVVPRLWGEPYLAKPPLFPWWVALHESALRATGLGAALRPAHGEPGWWPAARVGPFAVRGAAASSAALLAALVAFVVARVAQARADADPAARGFVAGALVALAPELLAKAPLGEIETTLALWCAVSAVGLVLQVLRPGPAATLVAVLGLGAALLAKGPVALVFTLAPAATFAVARVGWRAAARRLALPAVVGLGLFVWWPMVAGRALEGGDAAASWAAELARGGSGGLAVYLSDRLRLVGGLLGGFAPASLLALAWLRRERRGELERDPLAQFAWHAVVVGLAVLLLWPGVRPRYGLPLVAPVAVLGALPLLAPSGRRAARVVVGLLGAVALVLPAVAVVLHGAARDEDAALAPLGVLDHAILAASVAAGAAALLVVRRAATRPLGPSLLVAASCAFLGARLVQLDVLDGLRTDHRRAEAAAHLQVLCPSGLATDVWGLFNDLYYLEVPVRFAAAEDVRAGEPFLTQTRPDRVLPAVAWERLPLFVEPHWQGGERPRALPRAELWLRLPEVRPGD